MSAGISQVAIHDVPRRRGSRASALAPVVDLVLTLPPGRALRVGVKSLAEARTVGDRLVRMANDRERGVRLRTRPDAIYIWLDPDLDATARRHARGRRAEARGRSMYAEYK